MAFRIPMMVRGHLENSCILAPVGVRSYTHRGLGRVANLAAGHRGHKGDDVTDRARTIRQETVLLEVADRVRRYARVRQQSTPHSERWPCSSYETATR